MPTAIPADTTNGAGIGRSARSARSGTDATVSRAVTSRTVPASTRRRWPASTAPTAANAGSVLASRTVRPTDVTAVGNAMPAESRAYPVETQIRYGFLAN